MYSIPARAGIKPIRMIILLFSLLAVLACSLAGDPSVEQYDPASMETLIALRIQATSFAIERLTLQAVQTGQVQQQIPALQPTTAAAPTQPPVEPSSPPVVRTDVPASTELVLEIQTSVDAFYCYQPPFEMTLTVRVSDINRGMAVYYHIEDKVTGVASDPQVLDLHRKSSATRTATVIGGFGEEQNLQFPPLMGESYFIYQIISDDGNYRSPVYSDITFFPCAQ